MDRGNIINLTLPELLALDRVLSQIRDAIKAKKRSTSISLTNTHFCEMILKVASKRMLSEEEISALVEGLKKI